MMEVDRQKQQHTLSVSKFLTFCQIIQAIYGMQLSDSRFIYIAIF